jgi:hypothetical protein
MSKKGPQKDQEGWITPSKKKTARNTSLGRWFEKNEDNVEAILGEDLVKLKKRHDKLDPTAEQNVQMLDAQEKTAYVERHFAAGLLLAQGQTDDAGALLDAMEQQQKKVTKAQAPKRGSDKSPPTQKPTASATSETTQEPIISKPQTKATTQKTFGSSLAGVATKSGVPKESVEQFSGLLEGYQKAIPGLKDHFDSLFESGALMDLTVRDAKDAYYDPGSKEISLPQKKLATGGTDVLDVVDALLFETYNVERQKDYTKLHEDFMAGVDPDGEAPTMSLKDYGLRKSYVESEVTLKNAQALFALQAANAPVAYQGQRNLDKVATSILRSKLKGMDENSNDGTKMKAAIEYLNQLLAVDPEVGRSNPPRRDTQKDAYIKDIMNGILPNLDAKENASARADIISVIQNSQHNVKAKGDPYNLTSLKTCEVYAFEQMGGVKPKQWSDFLTAEVKKAFQQLPGQNPPPNIEEMGIWITDYVSTMNLVTDDYDYPMGRPQAVLNVLENLKEFYPEAAQSLKASFDKTFEMSEDMKITAKARFEKQKELNPVEWKKLEGQENLVMPRRGAVNLTAEALAACLASTPEQTVTKVKAAVDGASDAGGGTKAALAEILQWLTQTKSKPLVTDGEFGEMVKNYLEGTDLVEDVVAKAATKIKEDWNFKYRGFLSQTNHKLLLGFFANNVYKPLKERLDKNVEDTMAELRQRLEATELQVVTEQGMTPALAVRKLKSAGDLAKQLALLRDGDLQAQFGLAISASEIEGQYLGGLQQNAPADVQQKVATWPASDAKDLILVGLAKEIERLKPVPTQDQPTTVPEEEGDTGPAVNEELANKIRGLKVMVEKFVPPEARADINGAVDKAVRALGRKSDGTKLQAAFDELSQKIDGLASVGMKTLQLRPLKQVITENQEDLQAAVKTLNDLSGPVDAVLASELTNLKPNTVDKFVPVEARQDVYRAIDDVVRLLGSKRSKGGALRLAWQQLVSVVNGLTSRGMRALQLGILKTPLTEKTDRMEAAAKILDELNG